MTKKETKIAPCGCITAHHEDGRNIYHPCVACGLMRCATALSRCRFWWGRRKSFEEAAQAMAAVATTIQREKRNAKTVSDAMEGIKDSKE